jgi:tRNA(Ile)-lysidine synthase
MDGIDRAITRLATLNGRSVGVACSGGLDSVCLLRMAVKAGVRPVVLHVNYGLRGDDSNGDEQFVRDLAQRLGLDIRVLNADMRTGNKIAVQEQAREIRYAWFEQQGLQHILLAHHADDVAESFIMNVSRGSGLRGLIGIPAERGVFLRPLIGCSKHQLSGYLTALGESWREDASNESVDYTRNAIRHRVLPVLQEYYPAASGHISGTAMLVSDYVQWVQDEAARLRSQWMAGDTLVIPGEWRHKPYLAVVLYEVLHPVTAITRQNLALLMDLLDTPGKRVECPLATLETGRNCVYMIRQPKSRDGYHTVVLQPGQVELPEIGAVITVSETVIDQVDMAQCDGKFGVMVPMPYNGAEAVIRSAQAGERMKPFGLNGSKLLSDVYTDARVDGPARKRHPVMAIGAEVVWVLGVCSSEILRVEKDQNKVLFLRLEYLV